MKRLYYYLSKILFLMLLFTTSLLSQTMKEVVAIGESNGGDEASFLKARMNARREAIEYATGVKIYSSTVIHNYILKGDFIKAISRGIIMKEEIIEQKVITFQEDVTKIPKLRAFVKAKFTIKISHNKIRPKFTTEAKLIPSSTLRVGDPLRLLLESSENCYYTIFNYKIDGKITILYPNPKYELLKNNKLYKNERYIWPPKHVRDLVDYEVHLPENKSEITEYLIIVFSKSKLPIIYDNYNIELNLFNLKDFISLSEIISNVPLDSLFECIIPYRIIR